MRGFVHLDKIKCNYAVQDLLATAWAGWQPNVHKPLVRNFYPFDFVVPKEWKEYAYGHRPDWGSPWDSCDKVSNVLVRRHGFQLDLVINICYEYSFTGGGPL